MDIFYFDCIGATISCYLGKYTNSKEKTFLCAKWANWVKSAKKRGEMIVTKYGNGGFISLSEILRNFMFELIFTKKLLLHITAREILKRTM